MAEQAPDNLLISSPIEELGKHVPVKALEGLVDEVSDEQGVPKHGTKEALLDEVRELVTNKKLSIEQVSKLTQEYKFAGRVSISWGIPLQWVICSKEKLEQKILCRSLINPFEEEIRPQLTNKPALNRAEWLSDDMLRIEFTYAGKAYEVEDNYEKRIIVPTKHINSYLRLLEKSFLVETRANIRESKLVHNAVSNLLGIEVVAMSFSNQDIETLKQELKAKSKAVKLKRFGGDLDTVYVSAAPELDDLDNSEEYKSNFIHGDLKEARLELTYTTSLQQKSNISLHISSQGNIWFMSDVPEEIIEHVFSVVRKIKFLPPVRKLGLASQINKIDENKIQALMTSIREKGYGKRFNPRIYKTLGFEVDERKWIEIISKLVQLDYFVERFELICPTCHETLSVYSDYKDIPLYGKASCNHCSHEFNISAHDVLLTYSFKEDIDPRQGADMSQRKIQLALTNK